MNETGLQLLKEFEGFRSNAYLCPARFQLLASALL